MANQRRLRGIQTRSKQARIAPPPYQRPPRRFGLTNELEVAAVVEIVSVADPAVVPERLTGLVEPKLSLGGSCALAGLEVMAAVKVTLPVKPSCGEIVIVEVFPVVAPRATVTAVPLNVKDVTTIETEVVAVA